MYRARGHGESKAETYYDDDEYYCNGSYRGERERDPKYLLYQASLYKIVRGSYEGWSGLSELGIVFKRAKDRRY